MCSAILLFYEPLQYISCFKRKGQSPTEDQDQEGAYQSWQDPSQNLSDSWLHLSGNGWRLQPDAPALSSSEFFIQHCKEKRRRAAVNGWQLLDNIL